MKDFLKYVLATIVGIICTGFIMGMMSLFMFIVMAISSSDTPSVKNGTVLRIQLSGTLNERAKENPFAQYLNNDIAQTQGLDDIITAIKTAQTNDKIRGIYLEGGTLISDMATAQELRKALVDFKKSKKFILAYADNYSQGSYYIASVADKVLVNPSGIVDWHGLASQPIFFTDLLKKVGVKMQVFKVGTYKSAVEPYILTKMSDANREQVSSFVGDIWKNICADVASSRKISIEGLNAYADHYITFADAKDYVKAHLVDGLAYADEVRTLLRALSQQDKVNFIAPADLAKLAEKKSGDGTIAVYYAQGNIVDAVADNSFMSNESYIVGPKVVEDLDRLANDDNIKAVVLRINSGGGSAYASEQMWRAIQLLKKKKPVVVSMSGMAASGGYYMSCGADYIVAEPTTLTGSIGIFGMIPDASELLTDKLGLHFDMVKTNKGADFGAQGRAFNADEANVMQQYVNRGYRLFISRVAAGRHITPEQVDHIGQGRVWTGSQALKIKLVDKLGTLDDAIAEAASRAKLKDYDILSTPNKESWVDQILNSTVKRDYMEEKLRTTLGVYYAPLQFVGTLNGMSAKDYLQARIYYIPNIK
uniref:signal peptide peptidase SppA n=1 Tax=Alloprevotella sp. TaxID=1872471 RepID=UPI003FEDB04E